MAHGVTSADRKLFCLTKLRETKRSHFSTVRTNLYQHVSFILLTLTVQRRELDNRSFAWTTLTHVIGGGREGRGEAGFENRSSLPPRVGILAIFPLPRAIDRF